MRRGREGRRRTARQSGPGVGFSLQDGQQKADAGRKDGFLGLCLSGSCKWELRSSPASCTKAVAQPSSVDCW